MKAVIRLKGGTGSGNYDHAGRPGLVGGSSPEGGSKLAAHSHNMRMANPAGKDTQEQYMNADGLWTKERQAIHATIINHFFDGKTPVKDPQSYVLGGGPAAGKSTIINSGAVTLPENMVLAAGDDIKPFLPEYNGDNAPFVHEESSYLSKKIAEKAAKEGYNVLMDGTGDTTIESLMKKVHSMRSSGQSVHGIYVTVDMDTAIARSLARAKATGRYMPESVLRHGHASVSHIFPDIINNGVFDDMELFDTSTGKAVRVASAKGKKLSIHEPKLYKDFLAKAKG